VVLIMFVLDEAAEWQLMGERHVRDEVGKRRGSRKSVNSNNHT